jgi:hypothetical protein
VHQTVKSQLRCPVTKRAHVTHDSSLVPDQAVLALVAVPIHIYSWPLYLPWLLYCSQILLRPQESFAEGSTRFNETQVRQISTQLQAFGRRGQQSKRPATPLLSRGRSDPTSIHCEFTHHLLAPTPRHPKTNLKLPRKCATKPPSLGAADTRSPPRRNPAPPSLLHSPLPPRIGNASA